MQGCKMNRYMMAPFKKGGISGAQGSGRVATAPAVDEGVPRDGDSRFDVAFQPGQWLVRVACPDVVEAVELLVPAPEREQPC